MTMDAGYRDKDGYVAVMSRSDDVINVAGHRLSTGALEEVGMCFLPENANLNSYIPNPAKNHKTCLMEFNEINHR